MSSRLPLVLGWKQGTRDTPTLHPSGTGRVPVVNDLRPTMPTPVTRLSIKNSFKELLWSLRS